jgi:hypothetical protein
MALVLSSACDYAGLALFGAGVLIPEAILLAAVLQICAVLGAASFFDRFIDQG